MHVSTLYSVHSNHTGVTKPYTQCHSSQYRVKIHTSNIGHTTLYNYIIQLHYTTTKKQRKGEIDMNTTVGGWICSVAIC